MNEGNGNEPTRADALDALRDRGVTQANDIAELATPAEVLAACRRYDAEQGRKSPGLIVHWIRTHDVDMPPPRMSKSEQLRARFDEYAASFPIGTATMSHNELDKRLRPEEADDCAGTMIAIEASYAVLLLECDACGFENGIPVHGLHILGPVLAPAPELPEEPTEPMAF